MLTYSNLAYAWWRDCVQVWSSTWCTAFVTVSPPSHCSPCPTNNEYCFPTTNITWPICPTTSLPVPSADRPETVCDEMRIGGWRYHCDCMRRPLVWRAIGAAGPCLWATPAEIGLGKSDICSIETWNVSIPGVSKSNSRPAGTSQLFWFI